MSFINLSPRKEKYLLPEDRDFEILAKCKKLEKLPLTERDKNLVKVIESQLEENWRKPLIKKLNELLAFRKIGTLIRR